MPKPKDEPKPERRNSERAKDSKVYTDEERAKMKQKARQLAEVLEFNREAKKEDEKPKPDNWLDRLLEVE